MFDIQSKYKKLILTDISVKLALYFPIVVDRPLSLR